ncbi:hypothetical protein [Mycobacterium sp.]|uniref:hypothetical protein n=1 Tax=Mycobacterium sp. TaxID=1785 RepID=UPI003F971F13
MATAKIGPVTVAPLRVQPAYADRDAVRRTILDHAPYPLMIAGAGYSEMLQSAPLDPWFRTTWAADTNPLDASIQAPIDDPLFNEGAGKLFGAKIIQALVVNVMGPMAAGYRHVDLPTYRGISPKTPLWFPKVMGVSGLFERWAVRVAGALSWFYDGTDGEYEYSPRGIDHPSECERGPFGNVALFGDNDLMFHQVGAIGDAQHFQDQIKLTVQSEIRPGDRRWEITDGTSVIGTCRMTKYESHCCGGQLPSVTNVRRSLTTSTKTTSTSKRRYRDSATTSPSAVSISRRLRIPSTTKRGARYSPKPI